MFQQRKIDNEYSRPIGGDGKAYYAYLPAIFIYQDFSYSFVDEMEKKYYPKDGLHRKHFEMEQPNGTVVNKTFPGVSIFYLPFFCLATFFSWIFGFPVDGYSLLFQWSIPIAHLFYLTLALIFLNKAMRNFSFGKRARNIALFTGVFATNVYFYTVYDNTVAHIFGFFGASVLIWLLSEYRFSGKFKFIAWTIPLMALLLITRPTNAMMGLFFLVLLNGEQLLSTLKFSNWKQNNNWLFFLFAGLILFVPPLLWKLQSGNWIVYSYGEEGFDFLNPHFWEYLFSFQQGWWLWTPIMLSIFLMSSFYFFRQNRWQGVLLFIGILLIAYVFSSWWIWTFGTSFGQRPMIDFYPILLVGFAGFIQQFELRYSLLIIIPFAILNMFQSFQLVNGIIHGGAMTKEKYLESFFKSRRDPATVTVDYSWKLIDSCEKELNSVEINEQNPFSEVCQIESHNEGEFYVVTATISGKHEQTNCQVVFSGEESSNYQTQYLREEIYSDKRTFSFKYEVDSSIKTPISCYIWNNESEPVKVYDLKMEKYTN